MGYPRFRRLAHTADARILVWGTGEVELIANAVAAALWHALEGDVRLPPVEWHEVVPWPDDTTARLVQTVNEALFLLYSQGRVATAFTGDAHGGRLGSVPLGNRTIHREIKAATFHALRPHRRRGVLAAILTLDL